MLAPDTRRQFASDNYAGVCPEAWEAMAQANQGHARAYGDDPWTERASNLLRELFEIDCDVYFVFNGTSANSLALASLCQSYHSVLCHEFAHIETDECGGPEFFSNGTKILLVPGLHGKVTSDRVEHMVRRRADLHYPKPKILSLTQSTELGTVYTPDELKDLGETATRLGLHVHMDGARFANAVASLGVTPKEITWQAGVEVLCFGGTKNGMACGEAVLFFNRSLSEEFAWRCKQAGQLCSKMRFLAAPWVGMLESQAWIENARQANRMAALMEAELRTIPGMDIHVPRQANAVFAGIAPAVADAMFERGWRFYNFIAAGGARLMCSWDTTEEDVRAFAADLRELSALHVTLDPMI